MQLRRWSGPDDVTAGQVLHSQHVLFEQGDREPWTHVLEHGEETQILPAADLDDGTLVHR